MGRLSRAVVPAAIAVTVVLAMWVAVWSPPAAQAQAPSCIVGTWAATDLEPIAQVVGGTDLGLDVSELRGEFLLTIAPDGSYTADYDGVEFSASLGVFPVSGTLNGSTTGTYVDVGDGTLVGTVSGGTIEITVSLAGFPQTTSYEVPELAGAPASYQCDGDQLTIALVSSDPDSSVPVTFTRAR